jgi:hypothetical protein
MYYSISVILDLKKSNCLTLESLIYDIASNLNRSSIFSDYEVEGINNYIKKNNQIIIIEFEYIKNISDFIKIIKPIDNINIEYIYHDNNILYASSKYLNNLNNLTQNKTELKNKIIQNKSNQDYKVIYNNL